MKLSLLYFFKRFLPFSIILILTHFFVLHFSLKNYSFFYSIYTIYLFHIVTTAIVCLILIYLNKIFPEKVGFSFMALSVLKMLVTVLFLVPLIRIDKVQKLPDIIAFFVPYFFFLTFELTFIIKLLNEIKEK